MPFPTFKSLDEIPEAFRSEYEESNGEYVPREVVALRRERETREAAEKLAKKLAADLKEAQTKGAAKDAKLSDEELAKIRAAVEAEYAPVREELTAAQQKLRTVQLDNQVLALIDKAGVLGPKRDQLWKLVREQFDLTAEGTPIVKAKPTADLAKHIESFKTEFDWAFAAPAASGGGAKPTTGLPAGMKAEDVLKNPQAALEAAYRAA